MASSILTPADLQRLLDSQGGWATVRVTRVKSTIGTTPVRRRTVEVGLGLRKTNATRLFTVNRISGPVLKGMLRTAEGLVVVELVDGLGRRASASHEIEDSGQADGATMSETPYHVAGDRPALLFTHGKPADDAAEYVAVEAHDGFFALTWSSDVSVTEAVDDFLQRVGSDGDPDALVGIVSQGHGAETLSFSKAIELARTSSGQVRLLRLEMPTCTFVWSGNATRRFTEVGVMSSAPARALTKAMLKQTGSPSVKRDAEDLLRRATKVMKIALKSA